MILILIHNNLKKTKKNICPHLKKKHPKLVQSYSFIFNVLKNETMSNESLNRLDYMLKMAEKVNMGSIKSDEADVNVGQILVDQIVKPILNKNQTDKNKLY